MRYLINYYKLISHLYYYYESYMGYITNNYSFSFFSGCSCQKGPDSKWIALIVY